MKAWPKGGPANERLAYEGLAHEGQAHEGLAHEGPGHEGPMRALPMRTRPMSAQMHFMQGYSRPGLLIFFDSDSSNTKRFALGSVPKQQLKTDQKNNWSGFDTHK